MEENCESCGGILSSSCLFACGPVPRTWLWEEGFESAKRGKSWYNHLLVGRFGSRITMFFIGNSFLFAGSWPNVFMVNANDVLT